MTLQEELEAEAKHILFYCFHIPGADTPFRNFEQFQKISKESELFCSKKCGRPHLKKPLPLLSAKCPHWTYTPPLTADAFYGWPLTNIKLFYAFI